MKKHCISVSNTGSIKVTLRNYFGASGMFDERYRRYFDTVEEAEAFCKRHSDRADEVIYRLPPSYRDVDKRFEKEESR